MDEVDLGASPSFAFALAPHEDPARDSDNQLSPVHEAGMDDGYEAHDEWRPSMEKLSGDASLDKRRERLQRLRGSLQRRVTPLYQSAHNIKCRAQNSMATTAHTGDRSPTTSKTSMLREAAAARAQAAMQRMRRKKSVHAPCHIVDERLVFIGQSPLVQPKDDLVFIERVDGSSACLVERGDYIRVQSTDNPAQSWLCRVSLDRDLPHEADMLPLAEPFPGCEVLEALIYFVPRECLPPQLVDESADDDSSSSEEECDNQLDNDDDQDDDDTDEFRDSVDSWTEDDARCPGLTLADLEGISCSLLSSASTGADSPDSRSSRTSAAREKAAAFYEKYKTKKASLRLRTGSGDYRERLSAAKLASKEKLAAASQSSRQKLASAGQASKEKLAIASQASKEKLAVATQASKQKLAVASQASKEKLAVAGQASKQKLAAAGHASKEKLAVAGHASKEKLAVASHASKEKLAAASQASKQKLAVASVASKEKLAAASHASKEKLASASLASKQKLAVASQASKEKLAVASQASKEKLAVASQASKSKMQAWTSSARLSMKARMQSRGAKTAAAAAVAHPQPHPQVKLLVDEAHTLVGTPATPPAGPKLLEQDQVLWSYEPTVDDMGEEEHLKREMFEC